MNTNPESNDPNWERLKSEALPKPNLKGSEAFVQRVMTRIEEEEAKSFWHRFTWPQWTLAGAGAFALAAWLLLPSHQPVSTSSMQETALGTPAASLNAWDLLEPSEDSAALGTTIEEYFL